MLEEEGGQGRTGSECPPLRGKVRDARRPRRTRRSRRRQRSGVSRRCTDCRSSSGRTPMRTPAEVGRLLSRRGSYSPHLSAWRKAALEGALEALARKRGAQPRLTREPPRRLGSSRREVARLREELRKAHIVIEVQRKVSGLLGVDLGLPPTPPVQSASWPAGPRAVKLSSEVWINLPSAVSAVDGEERTGGARRKGRLTELDQSSVSRSLTASASESGIGPPSLPGQRGTLPNPSLLESGQFPARKLAEFAAREGRRPRPIYTAHKWFARRLGCVFRALLIGGAADPNDDFWCAYYSASDLRGLTILDPFVGGGNFSRRSEPPRRNCRRRRCRSSCVRSDTIRIGNGSLPDLALPSRSFRRRSVPPSARCTPALTRAASSAQFFTTFGYRSWNVATAGVAFGHILRTSSPSTMGSNGHLLDVRRGFSASLRSRALQVL